MPPGLTDFGGIYRDSFGEVGLPLSLPPGDTNHLSEPPLVSDSGGLALQRLVSRVIPQDELPSVIETIASNLKAADIVKRLRGNDAQTFADIIDQACHHVIPSLRNLLIDIFPTLYSVVQALDSLDLTSRLRKKCVEFLYKMCAGHTLLPRSLRFELHDDPIGVVVCRAGFADVSKHKHCDQEVAVKVLRARSSDGSQGMTNVGHCWTFIPLWASANRRWRL